MNDAEIGCSGQPQAHLCRAQGKIDVVAMEPAKGLRVPGHSPRDIASRGDENAVERDQARGQRRAAAVHGDLIPVARRVHHATMQPGMTGVTPCGPRDALGAGDTDDLARLQMA